jgi:hypothetical protein
MIEYNTLACKIVLLRLFVLLRILEKHPQILCISLRIFLGWQKKMRMWPSSNVHVAPQTQSQRVGAWV